MPSAKPKHDDSKSLCGMAAWWIKIMGNWVTVRKKKGFQTNPCGQAMLIGCHGCVVEILYNHLIGSFNPLARPQKIRSSIRMRISSRRLTIISISIPFYTYANDYVCKYIVFECMYVYIYTLNFPLWCHERGGHLKIEIKSAVASAQWRLAPRS